MLRLGPGQKVALGLSVALALLLINESSAVRAARECATVSQVLVAVVILAGAGIFVRLGLQQRWKLANQLREQASILKSVKEAELHGRRINEDLETRLKQRTDELAEANAELLQKQQENELFVYSVSHDLRSPLVNLQGFSQELSAGCEQLRKLLSAAEMPDEARRQALAILDDDLLQCVRFIQSAVTRLDSIIRALLRLSRAGKAEYRWQPVGVQKIVQQIVESSQAVIDKRGVTVAIQSVPQAWGDAAAVEQVFSNLIGNALKYLDPARPGHVEIGAVPGAAEGPTFFVRDNGLGIPEHAHGKIFRAFQRLHPEMEGEGIGLAVVSRIVERHGGRSWLESKAGQGSTFFVALPAGPAEAGAMRA